LPSPPTWVNQDLVLFHGTINWFETAILTAIDVRKGLSDRDFGRGFYMTTSLAQARAWAWRTSQRYPGSMPSIVSIAVDRDSLAKLESLSFVRGAVDAHDYWSFVRACRTSGTHHGRSTKQGWYDVVVGPVSRDWLILDAFPDADQFSFHTRRAANLLNRSPRSVVP
jgi:hypothetical protein